VYFILTGTGIGKQYPAGACPLSSLLLDNSYFIIETDASISGWEAILKQKLNKYSPKIEEKICKYASGTYKVKTVNNTDREILTIIHGLNAFRLYLGFKEFTVRTDCEAICRYYNKKSSIKRWVLFEDIITGNGYKIIFEHIKEKETNYLTSFHVHLSCRNDEGKRHLQRNRNLYFWTR
jgi:hypothetical protein